MLSSRLRVQGSAVVVGRHFAHRERELLGDIDAGEIFVGHICLAVREGEHDIDDLADAMSRMSCSYRRENADTVT